MPPPIFPNAPKSKPKPKETSILLTLLLFSPVLCLFFIGGVYFGSTFVDGESFTTAVSGEIGLPGTRNVLMKWGSQHLRGFDVAPLNHFETPQKGSENPSSSNSEAAAAHLSVPEVVHLSDPHTGEVAESHPITGAEIAHYLKDSLQIKPTVVFEGPSNMDNADILIGAWVYLDQMETEGTMRTIFTNKAPGCEASRDRYGVAMYVNEWETSNHELYVEYGNQLSGCNKISSSGVQLMPKKWYHVAVALVGLSAQLYIDGTIVGKAQEEQGHEVQISRAMTVGAFGKDDFPLIGNISHFAVAHPPDLDRAEIALKKIMHIAGLSPSEPDVSSGSSGDLKALFEFSDYSKARASLSDGSVGTTDIISGLTGSYHFPAKAPPGRGVAGVPIELVDGVGGRPVTPDMRAASDVLGRERREKVKEGMQFAWRGYRTHAWGKDELKPLTNSGEDPWGGMGVTLVDSLDTLWIMGMKEEYEEAVEWVAKSLTFDRTRSVSVFETTIRELGGLLSAFDLSKHPVLLEKAKDLGKRLIRAFDSGVGIPRSQVDLQSGASSSGWSGGSAILSELGTLQVEFRYLSQASGDPSFEKTVMKPLQIMRQKKPPHGLFPIKVSLANGDFTDRTVTFGALGDSFYEYLLKVWLQGGRKETWLRDMYDTAIDGVISVLLKASSPSGLAFLSDWDGRNNHLKMDHLVCFMPGLMTLGAYTDPLGLDSDRAQRDLAVAKALMFTCREMYHRTATGIAPEFVTFDKHSDMSTRTSAPFYILRPETAESLFVMNQLTGDPIYRDWAWEIWTAIDKHCRKGSGFGSLQDVNNAHSRVDNRMESFFLAETMKYLYLAQDPDNEMDLMKVVFNTEAHPTRIFDPSTHTPIDAK